MPVHAGMLSHVSHVRLFCDPMDRGPPGPSVHGFSRQVYWSGGPCPLSGDLPDPGFVTASLTSHVACIGRQVLYPWQPRGRLSNPVNVFHTAPLGGEAAWDEGPTGGGALTSCLVWSAAPASLLLGTQPSSTPSKHFFSVQRGVRALPESRPNPASFLIQSYPFSQGQPPSRVLPACPGPLPVSRQPLPGLLHLAVQPQLHPNWRPSPPRPPPIPSPSLQREDWLLSLPLPSAHAHSDLGLRPEAFLDAPRPRAQKVCEALSIKVKLLPQRGVGSYQGRVILTPPQDAGWGGVALLSRPPRLSLPQAARCVYLRVISAIQEEGILTPTAPPRHP